MLTDQNTSTSSAEEYTILLCGKFQVKCAAQTAYYTYLVSLSWGYMCCCHSWPCSQVTFYDFIKNKSINGGTGYGACPKANTFCVDQVNPIVSKCDSTVNYEPWSE